MTASPPPRTPARTVAQPDQARAALRYALVVSAGLVLLLVLVAGCGAAPLPPAAPATIAPTTPAPPPAPTTAAPATPPTGTPDAGTENRDDTGTGAPAPHAPAPHAAPKQGSGAGSPGPIWPAADAASARSLQNQVDAGRQPWLLDPTEVAISYAGAELGYRNPGVFPREPGKVDVQDGRSPAKATITLGQTVRRGEGGIWLVTGVQRR